MLTHTLPEGFISIDEALPNHDKAVLAIRDSGYIGTKYEILTARYMQDYRPNSPWRDLGMDSVHDSGSAIIGWREEPGLQG